MTYDPADPGYTPEPERCPAGGAHEWGEHDSGDAYRHVRRWIACENCHMTQPERDYR